jgi:uncharacterized protein with HEPN domain
MRSRSVVDRLTDIKQNIALARSFVANISFENFRTDTRTLYATVRCLEIISEASRRLPDDLKARHPNIRWRGMAGAGSIYRHDYEGVLDEIVWDTVQNSLDPLSVAVELELTRLAPE